jgi:phosphoribosylformylglycinamidine cyclo-ligase
MSKNVYARAGVNIALGNRLKAGLPELLASTRRPEVLGKVGGFGGLFALDTRKYQQPVLVSSVDGVGTKLKVAFAMNRHDTVGQDLVNHCINDIAVLGAEPLFFLDYIGTGKLEPPVFQQLIRGFAKACSESGCALIGGETAQMPGFYQEGEYDLSGTIVGVVEKKRMLSGKQIRAGDLIIGIAASGLHTNGYSLARKILFEEMKLNVNSKLPGLKGTVGQELLKVHLSYGPLVQQLLKRFNQGSTQIIKGLAHITGGGFVDNIPRVLPKNCNAVIRKGSWPVLPVFQILQEKGRVPEAEMYQVFNMGIGMTVFVDKTKVNQVLRAIQLAKHEVWIIGEVSRGNGIAELA